MDILITGGTGAFGQTLVSKLLASPTWERICIYSRDEHKQELMRSKFNDNQRLRFFIGDIRDRNRLALALRGIDRVVHAAALKVVPAAEYNPSEFIKTNIGGAQNLIETISEWDTTGRIKLIALSTDKAVYPVNLYGATKLCAEKLFRAANNIRGPIGPKYSIVRYGNVSNSTGSIIPLFQQQIRKGKQITLTHPDMTRFWITLERAVEFSMYCLEEMHGGEIFIPEMPSFKVMELGEVLYNQSRMPVEDQWFNIIGKRPGEKLHECIITDEEAEHTTQKEDTGDFVVVPAEWKIVPTVKGCITSDNVRRMSKDGLRVALKNIGAA